LILSKLFWAWWDDQSHLLHSNNDTKCKSICECKKFRSSSEH